MFNQKVKEFLEKYPESVMPPQVGAAVTTIPSTCTVQDALEILVDKKIISAPVELAPREYSGIIDMPLIAHHILDSVALHKSGDLRRRVAEQVKVSQTRVGELKGLAKSPFVAVQEGATMLECARAMCIDGVRRVAVVDVDGNLVNYITQSAIVKFIASNIDSLGELGNKTLIELGLEHKHVVVAHSTDSALSCFKTMLDKGLVSIPIVDGQGSLLTNISSTDIKALAHGMDISHLHLPVTQFIHACHDMDTNISSLMIDCTPKTTLQEVVLKLTATGIHRLYVVENRKPVGVISLTDILTVMCGASA